MLKSVKINLNVLENMLFFWQSILEKEKISDVYLDQLSKMDELSIIYDDSFSPSAFRTVLSAISNKEKLNTDCLKERQFWSKNMYMTEDPEILSMIITPIKQLNLDHKIEELNKKVNFPYEEVEVIFIPGFMDGYLYDKNKLYINVFKMTVDILGGTNNVTINGKSLPDFVCDGILEMANQH